MKKTLCLVAIFLFLSSGIWLLEANKQSVPARHADRMLEATRRTRAAFEAIRAERLSLSYPLNFADDPNGTGMVGLSHSEVSTTLGALDAKRSTTNPNVAAMLVDMFETLGIDAGDRVAVNLSGSFPCLNIALLCAADTLGIEAVSIFSFGASTYGANLPALTYGDMEALLYEQGLIGQRSLAFSVGGEEDKGLEMDRAARDEAAARIAAKGYPRISVDNVDENISDRFQRFHVAGPVRAFVNVGGNLLSFGRSAWMHAAESGILSSIPKEADGHGLVQLFLAEEVPVIQLLNMKSLLPRYGLPIDPVPLPADGEGGVYWQTRYDPFLAGAILLLGLCMLLFYRRFANASDADSR